MSQNNGSKHSTLPLASSSTSESSVPALKPRKSKSQNKLQDEILLPSDEPRRASQIFHSRSTRSLNTEESDSILRSFSSIKSTVHEIRRKTNRTASTRQSPPQKPLRKQQYLKIKHGKSGSGPDIRVTMSLASEWSTMAPRGTSVRHKHTCVAIPNSDLLLFYGGSTNAGTIPVHTVLIYNTSTNLWSTPMPKKREIQKNDFTKKVSLSHIDNISGSAPVTPREAVQSVSHSILQVPSNPQATDGNSSDDMSEYVPMSQMSLAMENRYSHSAVVWNGSVYIFGGSCITYGTSSVFSNTMLVYNHEKNEWWYENPAPGSPVPAARRGHSACLFGNLMYIFGGCGPSSEIYNDIWIYKFETREWYKSRTIGQVPSPRYFHSCCVTSNLIWIYGGYNGKQEFDTLYSFNPGYSTWVLEDINTKGEANTSTNDETNQNNQNNQNQGLNQPQINQNLNSNNSNDNIDMNNNITNKYFKPPAKQSASLISIDSDHLLLIGGSNPSEDSRLDIYLYDIPNAKWSTLKYDIDESISETNSKNLEKSSSKLPVDGMADKFNKREMLMSSSNRNRMFHTSVIPQSTKVLTKNRFCVFIFGGVNSILSNCLDKLVIDLKNEGNIDLTEAFYQTQMLNSLPKEQWEAAAMYYQPDVLSLHERMRVLVGDSSYSRDAANTGRTQASCTLGNSEVLNLVMEWLALNGYHNTLQRLSKDTRQSYIKKFNSRGSALELLLSFAKRRVKKGTSIWDDEILSILFSNGAVQAIDHLPDWYLSQEEDPGSSINPWDEAITEDNLRMDPESKKVTFASLNALVLLMLDYSNLIQQPCTAQEVDEYISCFFHTYHSFSSPFIILEKLIQLFDVPESTPLHSEAIAEHRSCIVFLIQFWIEVASWDWANDHLVMKLKEFLDGALTNSDQRALAIEVRQSLSSALEGSNFGSIDSSTSTSKVSSSFSAKSQSLTTNQLMAMNPLPGTQRLRNSLLSTPSMLELDYPDPQVPKTIFSSQFNLDDVPEIEIARQLTIIQFSLFCLIKPSELFNGWWKSEDAEYRAPHIRMCIHRNNIISEWVVACFSRPTDDKKARGKAVERIFKIAEHLRHLNNFETMAAILTGLRQAPEDLIERIDKRALEQLYKLDSSLAAHEEIIVNLDSTTPAIPNLKHILTEIAKIEGEAELFTTPTTKQGRLLLNVHKCRRLYPILRRVLNLQARLYKLLPVYQIISLLRHPGAAKEDIASVSLRIQLSPRNKNQ